MYRLKRSVYGPLSGLLEKCRQQTCLGPRVSAIFEQTK